MADHVFVAREHELNRLNTFLDGTLAGHGHVCFITGETGAGKTALVTEFARRAQNSSYGPARYGRGMSKGQLCIRAIG